MCGTSLYFLAANGKFGNNVHERNPPMSEEVTAPLSCRCGPEHNHNFGQGERRRAEGRLWGVAFITLVVMVVEILAGWLTGSMALLGDGIHMGGHALALGLAAAA